MPTVLIEHPLIHDALARLRDERTDKDEFRRIARRVSALLLYEATRDLHTRAVQIRTPLESTHGRTIDVEIVVVPVLRAGLGMLDAVLELLPVASVGYIGLQRDELTAVASRYYAKLPPALDAKTVLIVDPMLATGGSAVAAVDLLKKQGARDIRMICIVAAPEGVRLMTEHHPDVPIFTPAVDRELNDRKFILPGLGDFGDRLYGT